VRRSARRFGRSGKCGKHSPVTHHKRQWRFRSERPAPLTDCAVDRAAVVAHRTARPAIRITSPCACTTCHDSHAATQPHLINFNTTYALPLNGALRYTSTGMNHGTCTLTCHDGNGQNQPHNAKAY
jgi:hypothetical protein